ncbi:MULTISPECIES: hypothetical protein [Bacillus amyloliquefaciens group]|uniref:hypothetical protein n=1 Tax=Bacillus amyloliquefaciens group TaxID=1938374 RepID=UPI0010EFDCBD|nr:hypothetical protein [Bacillus velezensis]MCT6684573.1 hypothetical protein [Bacillus velezensis]MCY0092219.1 hypothetical protein [Bacillus velezensis]MEC0383446.1 hypothetical protein [Bacillus velezensis]MEC0386068.1 hypothetical protein [Bacillus velezensis]
MKNLKLYVLITWVAYIGFMASSALLQNVWLFIAGMAVLGVMLTKVMLNLKNKYASE